MFDPFFPKGSASRGSQVNESACLEELLISHTIFFLLFFASCLHGCPDTVILNSYYLNSKYSQGKNKDASWWYPAFDLKIRNKDVFCTQKNKNQSIHSTVQATIRPFGFIQYQFLTSPQGRCELFVTFSSRLLCLLY